MYLNKFREFKEQEQSRREGLDDGQINATYLQLKKVLRNFEDAIDEFELEIDSNEQSDKPTKKAEKASSKNKKYNEVDFKKPPKKKQTKENNSQDQNKTSGNGLPNDNGLLDLDVVTIQNVAPQQPEKIENNIVEPQETTELPPMVGGYPQLDSNKNASMSDDPFGESLQADFHALITNRNYVKHEEPNFL